MILVADSGSTKTDWCLVKNNGERLNFTSCGMNPYNIMEDELRKEIEKVVLSYFDPKEIKKMFFYGAGCSSNVKKDEMKNVFTSYFTESEIEINHDLLGAARALCGKNKGLVAILGTGSNSCLYDGINILENVPSLGYVLCDEGAGTNIGKLLLRNYLRHLMPEDLNKKFSEKYPGEESDFLNKLYKGPVPNYFLASFTSFAIENKNHPYCHNLIKEAFVSFFENQVVLYSDYNNYTINVVGSVGYFCKDIFEEVAKEYNINTDKFIKAPLNDLVDYHMSF